VIGWKDLSDSLLYIFNVIVLIF